LSWCRAKINARYRHPRHDHAPLRQAAGRWTGKVNSDTF
jgi:hypothetical protein